MKNNDGVGWVHDSSGPLSFKNRFLALWTLFMLFSISLLYMILVPAMCLYTYVYKSVWMGLLFMTIVISPFFARKHWPYIGTTFGFTAWRHYFAFRVYKEERLSRTRNVLLACVPHGLFPLSLTMLSGIAGDVFPEFQGRIPNTAVANVVFMTPILAPILTWLGCVRANKPIMKERLTNNNVIVVPDGIAGTFHSHRKKECVYIEQRKGFVKLAIEHGSLLVPVYCFGHSQMYDVYPKHDSWLARFSRRIRLGIVWFWGVRYCPPLPHRVPMMVVVGKGIEVMQDAHPTQENIDAVHALFKKELIALYEKHRDTVPGYENKELIVL